MREIDETILVEKYGDWENLDHGKLTKMEGSEEEIKESLKEILSVLQPDQQTLIHAYSCGVLNKHWNHYLCNRTDFLRGFCNDGYFYFGSREPIKLGQGDYIEILAKKDFLKILVKEDLVRQKAESQDMETNWIKINDIAALVETLSNLDSETQVFIHYVYCSPLTGCSNHAVRFEAKELLKQLIVLQKSDKNDVISTRTYSLSKHELNDCYLEIIPRQYLELEAKLLKELAKVKEENERIKAALQNSQDSYKGIKEKILQIVS